MYVSVCWGSSCLGVFVCVSLYSTVFVVAYECWCVRVYLCLVVFVRPYICLLVSISVCYFLCVFVRVSFARWFVSVCLCFIMFVLVHLFLFCLCFGRQILCNGLLVFVRYFTSLDVFVCFCFLLVSV